MGRVNTCYGGIAFRSHRYACFGYFAISHRSSPLPILSDIRIAHPLRSGASCVCSSSLLCALGAFLLASPALFRIAHPLRSVTRKSWLLSRSLSRATALVPRLAINSQVVASFSLALSCDCARASARNQLASRGFFLARSLVRLRSRKSWLLSRPLPRAAALAPRLAINSQVVASSSPALSCGCARASARKSYGYTRTNCGLGPVPSPFSLSRRLLHAPRQTRTMCAGLFPPAPRAPASDSLMREWSFGALCSLWALPSPGLSRFARAHGSAST